MRLKSTSKHVFGLDYDYYKNIRNDKEKWEEKACNRVVSFAL